MDKQKEQNLSQLMEDVDALVEDSDQLVKDAVLEHRKREKIKNMDMPLLWSQEELYEKKIVFTGMRQRDVLNAFREVRIRLLQRHHSDNMVVLVSSVAADVPSVILVLILLQLLHWINTRQRSMLTAIPTLRL